MTEARCGDGFDRINQNKVQWRARGNFLRIGRTWREEIAGKLEIALCDRLIVYKLHQLCAKLEGNLVSQGNYETVGRTDTGIFYRCAKVEKLKLVFRN
ncbi:hypothetical protein Zmor_021547 [Zophobas morio]|uniref:Uncharacterized protein n=1 Tax=Zophobas morio TaxID=2755281 RepID=A0AA38I8U9_9CUCU|nr:hypothetical protein Zmor_021547 [Zophobas morio]